MAELGITKNLSSQSQKLAAIPSETFEAKLAAGERRRFAFIRTKETIIKDPLDAFVHALLPLRKNPVANYADLASGIQEERDALDLYNKCFDAIDRISAALDALEVRFPSLKKTRELEWQAGSEIFAALRHAQSLCVVRANGRGSVRTWGSMVEARIAVGLRHWVKLAKKSTRQTTRFREYLLRGENQRGAHVQRRSHCRAGRVSAMIALQIN